MLIYERVFNAPLLANVGVQNKKWNIFKKTAKENFSSLSSFLEPERVFWKQQQKRFPFPLWGSICKEHYVMNWKLSYNVFVCRKETLIYTKKKEREREREKLRERDRNTLKSWKLCELKESIHSPSSIPLLLLSDYGGVCVVQLLVAWAWATPLHTRSCTWTITYMAILRHFKIWYIYIKH